MKKIKLFYLRTCPYCKKALMAIDQLKQEQDKYKEINIEMIEESENRKLSDSYDYHYVPCFYLDDIKVHEGIVMVSDIKRIFDKAIKE